MWKSIIYKEWIKLKWILLVFVILGVLVLTNIILKVRHDIIFLEATNFWYSILFRGYAYFSVIKFIPLLIGAGVAVAQYFPETVNKRIKLTFHLPINENEILLKMHAFGFGCITAVYGIFYLFFVLISSIYLPVEIVNQAVVTSLPWILGGIASYFMVSLVLLEPIWLYRGLYTLAGFGFVSVYYTRAGLGSFSPVLWTLAVMALMVSIAILFSGYRFRKGEM